MFYHESYLQIGDRLVANVAIDAGLAGDNTLANFGCRATNVAGNSMAQLIIPNNSASGNDIFCRNRLAPGNTPGALNTAPNVNAPIIQDSPFSVTHLTSVHARMESTAYKMRKDELMKHAQGLGVATRKEGTTNWRAVQDVRQDCRAQQEGSQARVKEPPAPPAPPTPCTA